MYKLNHSIMDTKRNPSYCLCIIAFLFLYLRNHIIAATLNESENVIQNLSYAGLFNKTIQSSVLHSGNQSKQLKSRLRNIDLNGIAHNVSSTTKYHLNELEKISKKHITQVIPHLTANFSIIKGELDKQYQYNVSKLNEFMFEYHYNSSLLEHYALRVMISSPAASGTTPVMVVVQQQKGVLSWQLPLVAPDVSKNYTYMARTICPYINELAPRPLQTFNVATNNTQAQESVQRLSIDVSTQSESPLPFNLTTTVFENFELKLDTPMEFTISPATPVFLQFKFPPDIDTVLVHATSNSTLCAALAVQKRECPVWDLEETMRFTSYYQTMSRKAAITLTKSHFPDGFYVTLIALRSDEACAGNFANYDPDRSKAVTVIVRQKITSLQLWLSIITGVLFCSVLYVLVIVKRCYDIRRDARLFDRLGPLVPPRSESSQKRRRRRRRSIARARCSGAAAACLHINNLTDTSAHECMAEDNMPTNAIVHVNCPSTSETLNSLVVGTCRIGPNPPQTSATPSASHVNASCNVPSETRNLSSYSGSSNRPTPAAGGSTTGSTTCVTCRHGSSNPQTMCSSASTFSTSAPTVLLNEGGTFDDLAELSREINESMSALQRDNPTIASETSALKIVHESDSSVNADPDTCSNDGYCIDDADSVEADAVSWRTCRTGNQCCSENSYGAAQSNASGCSSSGEREDKMEHRCTAGQNASSEHSCSVLPSAARHPRGMDHGVYFPGGPRPQCRQEAVVHHHRRFSVESDEGDDEFEASYCEKKSERQFGGKPMSCQHRATVGASRSKKTWHLQDLSRKRSLVLRRRSSRYVTTLLSCFIFYFVPVLQLVSTYQKVLDETGNQDICYYNFLCTNPVGLLSDFNHVFSNIGYMSFGILFAAVTYWRQARHAALIDRDANVARLGIPRDFGLYYALSMSLVMEGMLSACYHVCPNQSNFQFDTSFMYVIAVLLMLRLYQQRHPDITASADSVFIVLACSILFGVIGGLFGFTWFWVVSSVTHAFTCFLMSAYVYYVGNWSLIDTMRTIYKNGGVRYLASWSLEQAQRWRYWRELKSHFGKRVALLLTANLLNWALLLFGLVVRPRDYDTYLLGVFLLNLVVYVIFYLCMKHGYNEHLGAEVKLTLLFLVLVWVSSISVFFMRSTDWSDTPARSRDLNEHCIIFNFYDWHDVWHFLSAVALFTSFYLIMIIDDDLDYTPRDLISVF